MRLFVVNSQQIYDDLDRPASKIFNSRQVTRHCIVRRDMNEYSHYTGVRYGYFLWTCGQIMGRINTQIAPL